MIDLLLLMVLNALVIVGFYLSTGNDMIFEKPARWIETKISYTLTKPLFNCPTCMASVHSILPFWLCHDFSYANMVTYLFYIPALSAVSTFFSNKITEE